MIRPNNEQSGEIMRCPIIIDCDPGHDDALALLLAGASEELELLGVTVVAGNQTIDKTLYNALRVLTLAGLRPPVAAGAETSLSGPITPSDLMGETGLDGAVLPEPGFEPEDMTAVELLAKLLRESETPVTLVPIGPLTNIAVLLTGWPSLRSKIKQIVLMGGGTFGNITPAAEFNILTDPVAGDVVFRSGIPIVMLGLDVTYKALIFDEEVEQIRNLGNPVSIAVAEMMTFYTRQSVRCGYTTEGAHLYDPCTIAWLLDPTLFSGRKAHVTVETSGVQSHGMTVVDFDGKHTDGRCNAEIIMDIERERFIKLLMARLARY